MITSRKVSQVNVFAGSPWEVASVKSLLKYSFLFHANIIQQQCV